MPYYLQAPRLPKTPFFYIRGVEGIVNINVIKPGGFTTKTADQGEADRALTAAIEYAKRGLLPDGTLFADVVREAAKPAAVKRREQRQQLTLAQGFEVYRANRKNPIKLKRDGTLPEYFQRLIDHAGNDLLADVDNDYVADLAKQLYPGACAATLKRALYAVVGAICHANNVPVRLTMPKGARGTQHDNWLTQAEARAAVEAGRQRYGEEYGLLLELLRTTGMRIGETLKIALHDLALDEAVPHIRLRGTNTKTGKPRIVRLTNKMVAALKAHPRGLDRPGAELLFKYAAHKGGTFVERMHLVLQDIGVFARLDPNYTRGYHLFRHAFGTMIRAKGLQLTDTGVWETNECAAMYDHFVADIVGVVEAMDDDARPAGNVVPFIREAA